MTGTMEEKKFTISDRILDLDRRIIYIAMVLCLGIPLIWPWGLPIAVDPLTNEFYESIEALTPGSVVLLSLDVESGIWGSLGPQAIAVAKHLWSKEGIKFIQVVFWRPDGHVNFETLIKPLVEDETKKAYGIDWVNLGFIEGHEVAMQRLASDFLYPQKDAYGTLLSDLDLMQEVTSIDDIDLIVDIGEGDWSEMIRQIHSPYDKKGVLGISAMVISDVLTYKDAGYLLGVLVDLPGAAQYEFISGRPGGAIITQDALSAAHVFLIALVIITNIVYLNKRFGRKKA